MKNPDPKWHKVSLLKGQNQTNILSKKKYKKPKWLKVKLPTGQAYKNIRGLTKKYNLHTICESGNCPNMGECWGQELQLL